MKKTLLSMMVGIISTTILYADDILNATQLEMLEKQNYTPSGFFYQHDFEPLEDNSPFDWVFETPNGACYQLQGNKPTDDNLFGWKQISCTQNQNIAWLMIQVSDTDKDSSSKFDWVMISTNPDSPMAYKLIGTNDNATFKYSEKMKLYYEITYDENSSTLLEIINLKLEAKLNDSSTMSQYTMDYISPIENTCEYDTQLVALHDFRLINSIYKTGSTVAVANGSDDVLSYMPDNSIAGSSSYYAQCQLLTPVDKIVISHAQTSAKTIILHTQITPQKPTATSGADACPPGKFYLPGGPSGAGCY